MGKLVDQLGNKVEGELIRAKDWNGLVKAVEDLGTTLEARLDTLNAQVTANTATLATLTSTVDQLQKRLEGVLKQYYRVTLQTTSASYVIGQMAEVVAQVTDVEGNAVTFGDQERPWIDFVTSWGQLRAVAGFESLGGADQQTLTVRTNTSGLARVQLRSEYVTGLPQEAENDMAAALTTRVGNTALTVSEALLQANTPVEALPAYKLLSLEYDRSDAPNVRRYVDTHYTRNTPILTGPVSPIHTQQWRDYRTTVIAFVKQDNNPLTPDPARASSSIQVTFREWIIPWLLLDYLDLKDDDVQRYRRRLVDKVTPNYRDSVTLIKREVNDIVHERGIVGKVRDYAGIYKALDVLDLSQPPPFLNTLTESIQSAVTLQQTFSPVQMTAMGISGQEVAFDAFTNVAARSSATAALDESLGQLQGQLTTLEGKTTSLTNSLGSLGQRVDTFASRLDTDLPGLGERVGKVNDVMVTLQRDLGTLSGQVNSVVPGLQQQVEQIRTSVTEFGAQVTTTRQTLDSLGQRVDTAFNTFGQRVQQVEANTANFNTQLGNLRGDLTSVGTRTDQALQRTDEVQANINSIAGKVEGLQGLNAGQVQEGLSVIRGLDNRLQRLERG